MPPADEVAVVAGPRRLLVREGREKAGRSALEAGEPMHRRKVSVGQHQLSADVAALVVGGLRAGADVDSGAVTSADWL